MFEKMSKAVWSKKLPEEEVNRKTSQMDREVAAGWFDLMLIDMDFKFVNYKHNIPEESFDDSRRSSYFSESSEEKEEQ